MSDIIKTKTSTRTQLIVFKLGNEEFGLLLDEIKEVVLTPAITAIPQTPDYIKGVANIRGNIISIYDLEQKFGIVKEENDIGRYTLVSENDKFKLGILVKNVPDTLTVEKSTIDENVSVVQGNHDEKSGYVKGIIKVNERLIILLDLINAVSESEVNGILDRVRIS